jgi:hypothetical protein
VTPGIRGLGFACQCEQMTFPDSAPEQVVRRGRQFGLLTRRDAEHSFDLRWWSAFGPLVASAALIGFGWRAVTAQVIGANIGAGCVILFGGPLVFALLGGQAPAPSP